MSRGDRKFKTIQANRNYLKWQTETWNVRIVPLKKVANFFKNLLTFTYLCGIMVIVQRGMKARVMSSFLYMKIRVVSKNPLVVTKKER